jgi:hypothetical protein
MEIAHKSQVVKDALPKKACISPSDAFSSKIGRLDWNLSIFR